MSRTGPGIRLTRVALVATIALATPAVYLLIHSGPSMGRIAGEISAHIRGESQKLAADRSARQASMIADALSGREPGSPLTEGELENLRAGAGAMSVRLLDTAGTELLRAGQDPVDAVRAKARVEAGSLAGSEISVAAPIPGAASSLQAIDRTLRSEWARLAWRTAVIAAVGLALGLLALLGWQTWDAAHTRSGKVTETKGEPAPLPDNLGEMAVSGPFLEQLLDSTHDGVFFLSPDLRVIRTNPQALGMLAYDEAQLLGQPLSAFVPEDGEGFLDAEGVLNADGETDLSSKGGHRIRVTYRSNVLEDSESKVAGHILVFRNITDETRTRKRVQYLTRFDSLTRVANRIQFQHKLQQGIARASRNGLRVALLYVDLDRFKDINDTFGHPVGDRSLEITARRLVDALEPGTLVGRLAGDEFAILLDSLPAGQDLNASLAATARMLLDAIAKEFYVEGRELFVTASLGIALCPDDADNVVDLIRNADAAMYHAKENGGNTYGFYSPRMNANAVDRLVLKNELRHALIRKEFQVLYQPKIDLEDGRVAGAEALLRWRHPKRGEVPPAVFIPLAEDSGLIFEIGAWVLSQVCRDYAMWQTRLAWPGRVAVNLSLTQLRQKDFVARVERIFEENRLTPSCLELEITESTLMRDGERTLKLLDRLYQLGLHLCIDDFGTGYSSLSALQHFPIGTLKIDQSFVKNALHSPDSGALVATIINMGQNLGMDVVAEGVETEEQLAFLRSHRCAYGQGHLFGGPVTGDDYLQLLVEQQTGEAPLATLFH